MSKLTILAFYSGAKTYTVTFSDGQDFSISKDNDYANEVARLAVQKDAEGLLKTLDLATRVEVTGTGECGQVLWKLDGYAVKLYNEDTGKYENVPLAIEKKVLQYVDEGLPPEPLMRFWTKLQRNPSALCQQRLFDCLEVNEHPITEDGCFIAYRSIRKDWKDKHSGTMDNSVGRVLTMPREDVCSDMDQTCAPGLHVASFDYANHSFGSSGDRLVICKVHPEDVVAIPRDYNSQKMRTCRFEVLAEMKGPRKELTTALYDDEDFSEEPETEWYYD